MCAALNHRATYSVMLDTPLRQRRTKRINITFMANELCLLNLITSATAPTNERAGLAFLLRAAVSESTHPGSVKRMALRMCDETIKSNIDLIKRKHAKKLAHKLKEASTEKEQDKLVSTQTSKCNFEIDEFNAKIHAYMNPAPIVQAQVPLPIVEDDLDFNS